MKTDVLLDANNDLLEDPVTYDLVEGRSDEQHQGLLIISEKGSWKETPLTGVGAESFLESEDPGGLLREIRLQFAGDGMTMSRLDISDGKLNVDASY